VTVWRQLDTGVGTPSWNMALDEALLERFASGDAPILRLYSWKPAALSLGRFQKIDEVSSVPDSVERVRRITGGGALHHREDELTYAIVAPYAAFAGAKRAGPKVAYRAVHDALALGLELAFGVRLGTSGDDERDRGKSAPLCYDRATSFDLKAGEGRKLVGSAQRRRGVAFLQHGAIPVSRDPFSTGAVSLEELLGRIPSRDEVARAIALGFTRALDASFERSEPRPAELALARELERARYGSRAWTAER
jgi:lipoate-protein ligase A